MYVFVPLFKAIFACEGRGRRSFSVTCPRSDFRKLGEVQAKSELAGAHVSDIIAEPTLALQLGAKAEDLAKTIHAHPTLAEGIFETVHLL